MLCSCGWDDVKDYDNFTCYYESSDGVSLKDNTKLTSIKIFKTDSAVKVLYNNITDKTLINNKDNTYDTHTVNGTKIHYKANDAKNFIDEFVGQTNSPCPSNIYLKGDSSDSYDFKMSCTNKKKCKKFIVNEDKSTQLKLVSPFMGTCYCQSYTNPSEINGFPCEQYFFESNNTPKDFEEDYVGVCEAVCESNSGYWVSDTKKFIESANVSIPDYKKKDCIYTGRTNYDDDNPNCSNNYNQVECEANTGDWDDNTKCCSLKPKCWFLGQKGEINGKVFWQIDNPCLEAKNKDLVDKQCEIAELSEENCKATENADINKGELQEKIENQRIEHQGSEFELNGPPVSTDPMNCSELLGPNLTKIVRLSINIFRIAGAIIAIVNGMMILIPAVSKKDEDLLKKGEKKLIIIGIVLFLLILLPSIVHLIGSLFNYDLSCIFNN